MGIGAYRSLHASHVSSQRYDRRYILALAKAVICSLHMADNKAMFLLPRAWFKLAHIRASALLWHIVATGNHWCHSSASTQISQKLCKLMLLVVDTVHKLERQL